MPAKHTFLFQEGTWRAAGHLVDARGRSSYVEGEARTRHGPERWDHRGRMWVPEAGGQEFRNDYRVVPFTAGSDVTTWRSANPDLGELRGEFTVIGASILSTFRSIRGDLHGAECLLRLDDTAYRNCGVAFRSSQKISSWALDLVLERPP